MSSINQCITLDDSQFICSTGAFLQLFDARNLTKKPIRRQACSSFTLTIDKIFYAERLDKHDIVAFTCQEKPKTINFLDFNQQNSLDSLIELVDRNVSKSILLNINEQPYGARQNFQLNFNNTILSYEIYDDPNF